MRIKLTNMRSRVTNDLHSGSGYTNTLTQIESVCTFKLGEMISENNKNHCESNMALVEILIMMVQHRFGMAEIFMVGCEKK